MSKILVNNIPQELKQINNWVLHKNKVPRQPSGANAKPTDPKTWISFDTAIKTYENNKNKFDGIGFVFSNDNDICGIDIDKCRNEKGELNEFAQDIINTINSYTEYSPSGKGIHIICKAKLPDGGKRKDNLEMYETGRYFTFTGNILKDSPTSVNKRSNELLLIHDKYISNKDINKNKNKQKQNKESEEGFNYQCNIDCDVILSKMFKSRDGKELQNLFEGNWEKVLNKNGKQKYNSESESVFAFCNRLAFWCNKDAKKMEEICKLSKLYSKEPSKWDRDNSIKKAIMNCENIYDWNNKNKALIKQETKLVKIQDNNIIEGIEYNKKGGVKQIISNVITLLKMKNYEVYYSTIKKKDYLEAGNNIRDITDELITELYSYAQENELNMSRANIDYFIKTICKNNERNEVEEYLLNSYNFYKNEFVNNKDYIRELFDCLPVIQDDTHDLEFSYLLFKRWMVQAVRMACNNLSTYQGENLLVLQGKQGIRKTTFLKNLCPSYLWFREGLILNTKDKDSKLEALSHWICELGELDGTLKREQAELKAFFSSTKDIIRVPYARRDEIMPRTTVFCASVNKLEFLKDETGGRRFWILKLDGVINIEKQKNLDINKIWAYTFYLYKNEFEKWWLESDEIEILHQRNKCMNISNEFDVWLQEIINPEAEEKKVQAKKLLDIARQNNVQCDYTDLKNSAMKNGIKTINPQNKIIYLIPTDYNFDTDVF